MEGTDPGGLGREGAEGGATGTPAAKGTGFGGSLSGGSLPGLLRPEGTAVFSEAEGSLMLV